MAYSKKFQSLIKKFDKQVSKGFDGTIIEYITEKNYGDYIHENEIEDEYDNYLKENKIGVHGYSGIDQHMSVLKSHDMYVGGVKLNNKERWCYDFDSKQIVKKQNVKSIEGLEKIADELKYTESTTEILKVAEEKIKYYKTQANGK